MAVDWRASKCFSRASSFTTALFHALLLTGRFVDLRDRLGFHPDLYFGIAEGWSGDSIGFSPATELTRSSTGDMYIVKNRGPESKCPRGGKRASAVRRVVQPVEIIQVFEIQIYV